mgnify:CR=1 FL=1
MWRNCDHWVTGEFEGFPDLSRQPFALAYERAPAELRAWVQTQGVRAGIRWLFDFAHYVRMRAKAEGCRLCFISE